MEHKKFVEKYKNGEIEVSVSKGNSLTLTSRGYLPKQYLWVYNIWSLVWFISIPVGIILLFINFGIGILVLFFISFLLHKAITKSVTEFVLEHALKDENFYKFTIQNNTLIIRETKSKINSKSLL